MKKIIISVLCVLIVLVVAVVGVFGAMGDYSYIGIPDKAEAPAVAEDGSLVFMSANIRRQEKFFSFSKMDIGTHRWWKRAQYYLENVKTVAPDVLGAQEVQAGQYEFLKEHLVGYASVVAYRDERGHRSESCPIFYNEKRFELLDSGTFWLSDTPDKMSKYEESDEYRITTFVKLKDKTTGITIVQYLTVVRIRQAARLLRETDLAVTEISDRCGFGDVTYFEKVFRRLRGMTPRQYRSNSRPQG